MHITLDSQSVSCTCMHVYFIQILSMLEEAAGTKLYESKKLSAEKTIGKKDMKLKEIDQVYGNTLYMYMYHMFRYTVTHSTCTTSCLML